jgi:transposase InsO family protein
VVSERLEFVALAEAGSVSFAELCRRFGISRQTGYVWWGRWRRDAEEGLVDRSRRPRRSPTRTDAAIEELVVAVRDAHPVWGGRKISRVLTNRGVDPVPAPSTITGILRRYGRLVSPPPPRGYQRFERAQPNELWQMDFKGWFQLTDHTRCHPFGVLDDHSRFNVVLAACPDQRTVTVQTLLTAAFTRYGMPEAILCDNGSPWGATFQHRWTPLAVWLIDRGVHLVHSRPYHPQTAGKQERFHWTLELEVLTTRPAWDTLGSVQAALDTWREVYNHHRPHDALDLQVPAHRYHPSPRPLPTVITAPEYPTGYLVRTVDATARIGLHNRRIRVGKAFRGLQIGIRPDPDTDGTYHLTYRDQPIRTINLTTTP